MSEGAEGGANVFKMDYFGKQVYLAQSPQFYKQIGVGVYERVFEIAPAYRAEKHATSRHLNEYISLDVEMGFIKGQEDVMTLEAALLRYIIAVVERDCAHELQLLNAVNPVLPEQVPAWKLSEVHEILWENKLCEADHRGEDDLAPEEERAICKYAKEKYDSDFVFVTHFPSEHRAFYAMDDPEDPSLTLSFDLLMRGLEITSGGQRIHKEADYREKMLRRGMNPDAFRFYLDTFRNGMDSSVSPLVSSVSPTSRNAPCSPATSTASRPKNRDLRVSFFCLNHKMNKKNLSSLVRMKKKYYLCSRKKLTTNS